MKQNFVWIGKQKHTFYELISLLLPWASLVVRMSALHAVGHGLASQQGHTKDHHMVQTASLHDTQCIRVGVWQCCLTA